MKLVKGSMNEDRRRDIFWQRFFIENDQGEVLSKVVICASQEYLASVLDREMINVQIDDNMERWFISKSEIQYMKFRNLKEYDFPKVILDIYPQSSALLQFAESV